MKSLMMLVCPKMFSWDTFSFLIPGSSFWISELLKLWESTCPYPVRLLVCLGLLSSVRLLTALLSSCSLLAFEYNYLSEKTRAECLCASSLRVFAFLNLGCLDVLVLPWCDKNTQFDQFIQLSSSICFTWPRCFCLFVLPVATQCIMVGVHREETVHIRVLFAVGSRREKSLKSQYPIKDTPGDLMSARSTLLESIPPRIVTD